MRVGALSTLHSASASMSVLHVAVPSTGRGIVGILLRILAIGSHLAEVVSLFWARPHLLDSDWLLHNAVIVIYLRYCCCDLYLWLFAVTLVAITHI